MESTKERMLVAVLISNMTVMFQRPKRRFRLLVDKHVDVDLKFLVHTKRTQALTYQRMTIQFKAPQLLQQEDEHPLQKKQKLRQDGQQERGRAITLMSWIQNPYC